METLTPEEELKRLLLSPELDLLERLEQRLTELQQRVGDDPALEASTRRVIVNVLRDAGAEDHERLSTILAPLMLSSLRAEIRSSRDMMVEALYPLTGRLVSAAVRNAFRDLLQTLDSKLNQTFSLAHLRVRLEALVKRRPAAELMLQRFPPFEIRELLVIHRPTGLLIARAGDEDDEGGIDRDLVGSMLNAVMALTRDAFGDRDTGELSTVEFGESQLFVKSSPTLILVAVTKGVPPRSFDATLEGVFLRFLDGWGRLLSDFDGALDPQADIELGGYLKRRSHDLASESRHTDPASLRRPAAILVVVLLLLLGWIGYRVWDGYRVGRVEAAAREAVEDQALLAGYPIDVRFDRARGVLFVGGLAPTPEARDALVAAVGAAVDGRVDYAVNVLPTLSDEPDPVEILSSFVRENAIYFSEGTTPRAPESASATLADLAGLVLATPAHVRLRLIGYADPLGSAAANAILTLERAQWVFDRLVELGVPSERLNTVGRPGERLLTQEVGQNSDSRRAEFEVYFTER